MNRTAARPRRTSRRMSHSTFDIARRLFGISIPIVGFFLLPDGVEQGPHPPTIVVKVVLNLDQNILSAVVGGIRSTLADHFTKNVRMVDNHARGQHILRVRLFRPDGPEEFVLQHIRQTCEKNIIHGDVGKDEGFRSSC